MTHTTERAKEARRTRAKKEVDSETAHRAYRERKAREKGRVWLYGLDEVMQDTGVNPQLASEQVDVHRDAIRNYARVLVSAPLGQAHALAGVLGVRLEDLTTQGSYRPTKPGLSVYDLLYVGMPSLEELSR